MDVRAQKRIEKTNFRIKMEMESMLSMCLHPSRLASLVPVYVQKKVKE